MFQLINCGTGKTWWTRHCAYKTCPSTKEGWMENTIQETVKWFDLNYSNESGEFVKKPQNKTENKTKPKHLAKINAKHYIHQK